MNIPQTLTGMATAVLETADAMANDGVKRETVQVYVLDKELEL